MTFPGPCQNYTGICCDTPTHRSFAGSIPPATGEAAWERKESFSQPPRAIALSTLRCPWPRESFSLAIASAWATAVGSGSGQCQSRVARIGTARGFHSFRAQGSWACSVWVNGLPEMYNFKSWKEYIFQSLEMYCSHNYFINRIIAKETGESSFPWCLAPAEAGTGVLRTVPTSPPQSVAPCSLSFSPSLPLCVLQLQHKLFAREVSLYDPIQHTQEKTVGDRPNVLTNLS